MATIGCTVLGASLAVRRIDLVRFVPYTAFASSLYCCRESWDSFYVAPLGADERNRDATLVI